MKTQVDLTLIWPANSGQCVNFYRLPEQGNFITKKATSREAAVFTSTLKDTLCIIICRTNVEYPASMCCNQTLADTLSESFHKHIATVN
jgi:hypothetical protein